MGNIKSQRRDLNPSCYRSYATHGLLEPAVQLRQLKECISAQTGSTLAGIIVGNCPIAAVNTS
uniref:Uncharacterized protein n=1 Tax=Arion vulgaris TaxID=1028688 RepID=A0A0B6YHM1_9EUPU